MSAEKRLTLEQEIGLGISWMRENPNASFAFGYLQRLLIAEACIEKAIDVPSLQALTKSSKHIYRIYNGRSPEPIESYHANKFSELFHTVPEDMIRRIAYAIGVKTTDLRPMEKRHIETTAKLMLLEASIDFSDELRDALQTFVNYYYVFWLDSRRKRISIDHKGNATSLCPQTLKRISNCGGSENAIVEGLLKISEEIGRIHKFISQKEN